VRYLSVCSGIEAATVAWHPLGWNPVGFSEIEPFPASVLQHHYPDVPNFGDMTQHESWPLDVGSVDLLVGGTPCQSFSVAGLRQGLRDPRGGLMLTYLEIARRLQPRWVVWENVPGVLSSGGGRDFGSFLGALGQLGYGWAYRVLDAQWVRTHGHPRAVPQRRRRVFVVGRLIERGATDAAAAAAVLFERESVSRHPAKSASKGEGTSAAAQEGTRTGRWWDGGDCAATLTKQNAGGAQRMPDKANFGAVIQTFRSGAIGNYAEDSSAGTVRAAGGDLGGGSENLICGALNTRITSDSLLNLDSGHYLPFRKAKRAQSNTDDESWVEAEQANTLNAFDTGERDTHAVAHAFYSTGGTHGVNRHPEVSPAVKVGSGVGIPSPPAVAHALRGEGFDASEDGTGIGTSLVPMNLAVRRLTPVECERLQGFPDNYTLIPYRGKSASVCPDGPRYKALGNSMAVNCMEWLGERIAAEEARNR
jgi:DNA (cytosine-5)-methyltransferase 1